MKYLEAIVYVALLASSLFANKYVLSVLGFQYPMVFQGWQTLVGCVTFKVSLFALIPAIGKQEYDLGQLGCR